MQENEKLMDLSTSMSCLISVVHLDNESEMFKMIEMMNELRIAQKYLVIFIDTFTATNFDDQILNFNVMINHNKAGIHSRVNLYWLIFIGK